MMRNTWIVSVAVVALTLQSAAVGHAASVQGEKGTVLVNKGDGFAQPTPGVELPAGAQVMVPPGGLALITYNNSCAVRVDAGLWHVQTTAPCANDTTLIDFSGRMRQRPPPQGTTGGPNITPFVIGGVVIAGGVGLVVLMNKDKDKPASP